MTGKRTDQRGLWLMVGCLAGLAIATIWPHEPVSATSADRNEKFAIITTQTGVSSDGVFVLDFLTGRLSGAVLGRTRTGTAFLNFYFRNVAEDFQVDPSATPYYAISQGQAEIQARGGAQFASSALYVAEMSSGKVASYAIPFRITQTPQPVAPLIPIDTFSFREQTVTQ